MDLKSVEQPGNIADHAAEKADAAIRATQRATNNALDGLSATVQDTRTHISPMLNRASEQAAALAQRGIDAVRTSSQQVREKAVQASDVTAGYIRNDPIKAVLIAAATGAALMALVGLLSRSRRD
ncbi:MAG TPA: hypothetical protein VHQ87_06700 [Rhizobacter sp.]|nr:hypothetical protein [Rhizobacter sp.]